MSRPLFRSALLLAICMCVSRPEGDLHVLAQSTNPSPAPPGKSDSVAPPVASPQEIQKLIEQLGSDTFQTREDAAARLLQIGEAALLPLSAAQRGRDSEISVRAKAIRDRIENEAFESVSLSFKRDTDPNASYGLPGWQSFSKIAGSSRPAKRLFLKLLQRRRIVALCLESLQGGQVPEGVFEGLPEDPQARLKSVIGKTCTDIRHSIFDLHEDCDPGDLIALLVAIQYIDMPTQDLHDVLRTQCNQTGLSRLMQIPGAQPAARKLLGGWFLKLPVTYGDDVFNWGQLYKVPETADMARRVLNSAVEVETQAFAILSLSKFGEPADLNLIDKFIDNQTVLFEFNPPMDAEVAAPPNLPQNPIRPRSSGAYVRRLGDVALFCGAKLLNMDLPSLFPAMTIDDSESNFPRMIGFPIQGSDVREQAIKAYKLERAKIKQPAS